MKINVDKCKILSEDPPHLSVKTTALKKVDTFVFLGLLVPKTENMKRRMKKNIWSAKDRKKTEIKTTVLCVFIGHCNIYCQGVDIH